MNQRNYLQLGSVLVVTVALAMSSEPTQADILSARADVRMGPGLGKGMFGARKDDAFHEKRGTLGYGFLVGAELLFIDTWVQHDQFLTSGAISTWTQFMLGFDVEIDVGAQKAFQFDDAGKKVGGYASWYVELGMGGGFGVGTGQQVELPLDNGEVTDKGFLLEGRAMLAYRINSLFSVGATLPVQFGYFTKSGAGAFSNNTDNHYAGASGSLMLTFRSSYLFK